jgi:hypothetical protein
MPNNPRRSKRRNQELEEQQQHFHGVRLSAMRVSMDKIDEDQLNNNRDADGDGN